MRIASLAAAVCLAGAAVAQVAPDTPEDGCCCCDVDRVIISCTHRSPRADCVCPIVKSCPTNAKTVWELEGHPHHHHHHTVFVHSEPSPLPVRDDAHQEQAAADVAAKMGDDGKPVDSVPKEVPEKFVAKVKGEEDRRVGRTVPINDQLGCCCCDLTMNKVVCHAGNDDCFCAMVLCPMDAETIYVMPTAPTRI
ncbi:hypothetical protein E4U55_003910 [Claviceps digitariae]|nr:hypothetical protein E4U55_003910 [Claviceps digitariae]